jgi:hypothetical protein
MTNSFRVFACLLSIGIPLAVFATLFNWQGSVFPSGSDIASVFSEVEGPRAVLQRKEHDFGHVKAGALLLAGFRLENTGNKRLIVREQARGCECVTVNQPEVIVPPGGSRTLAPGLDTKKFEGALKTTVEYRTNDPQLPTITLVLMAEVTPSPEPTQTESRLEPIPAGE